MRDRDDSPWKDGNRSAAMFSFDLDAEEMWRVKIENDSDYDKPLIRTRGSFGPETAVPRILDLFDTYGLRCTFFIPGRVMELYPDLTRRIADAGHEIGHHGYTHRPPTELSPEEQRSEIRRGLDTFDEILGTRPAGYRSPGGELTNHTLEQLVEHGIQYDSSLIDDDLPYAHEFGGGHLIEVPNELSLEDWPYFGFNYAPPFTYSGGIESTESVLQTWRREFHGIHEYGRYFLLTLHPQIIGRAGRIKMLEELIKEIVSTDDTWITTGKEIADHWRTHHIEN